MSIYINYLYKREGAEKSVCVFDKILKAENCLDCIRGGARRGGGGAADKPRQARGQRQRDKSQSVERLGTRGVSVSVRLTVQANILVYEGAVIGGDICSTELDGFMQGFDFPTKNAAQNESTKKKQPDGYPPG